MKKKWIFTAVLCLLLVVSFCACGEEETQVGLESSDTETETEVNETTPASVIARTGDYLLSIFQQLSPGDGDWIIIGLARSGEEIPVGLFDSYYAQLEQQLTESGGVLDATKVTDYFRSAVMVTAIGKDPRNVAGYDLLVPAADYEKTCAQGLNGPIWALIALHCGGYEMPASVNGASPATEEIYVDHILSSQLENGGFSLVAGGDADVDVTAMAIQALSFCMGREDVSASVEKAVSYLSSVQDDDGGFSTWGEANIESCAQVLTAMAALDIAVDDDRFVKNGCTVFDGIMDYSLDDGTFMHNKTLGTEDAMATEQAFLAVVALNRMENGESFLYDMTK